MPKGALLIEIFRADNTAYSKKLNKVREMLSKGIAPPVEFSRPAALCLSSQRTSGELPAFFSS